VASTSPPNLRDRIRQAFLGILLTLVGLVLVAYGIDFAAFRIRAATNRNAYGSVIVSHYYAVQQKNGKTQFIFEPPQPETCVNALFPHSGMVPCWYLKKHPEQRTDI
jgi:hypothetical protein